MPDEQNKTGDRDCEAPAYPGRTPSPVVHLHDRFIVVRDEGKLQVGSAQNKRIASGAIFRRATQSIPSKRFSGSARRVSSRRLGISLLFVPRRPSSVTSAKNASIIDDRLAWTRTQLTLPC
jgi:hypothetical protein